MNFENIYSDIYLQEIAWSTENEGFKIRLLDKRKIEWKGKKIEDFEILLRTLRAATNIDKALKNVGYAYIFPFSNAAIKNINIAQQTLNYYPALISPLPLSDIYQEVFVKKGLEKKYGYIRIIESKTRYDFTLNKFIIFIEDIEKVDEIRSYEHFNKSLSNDYQKIFSDLFYGNNFLSVDLACSSLSADLGLSYSLASKYKNLLKPDIYESYSTIQRILPIQFRKEPFYLPWPNSNILMSGNKLKVCFYPQNAYNFENDLRIQPYHAANSNQTLAALIPLTNSVPDILDNFTKANFITNLDEATNDEKDNIFNKSIPVIDEEMSIWLIHRRNASFLPDSTFFVDKFSNFLKGKLLELPDELITFLASYSPLKDGFERSFQAFNRLGILKNSKEYSGEYERRFEDFFEETRTEKSALMKYINEMTKNKSGEEGKVENAIQTILLINKRIPHKETINVLEHALNIDKKIVEKVIRNLDKSHWLSITLSGNIKRNFEPKKLQ